MPLYSGNCVLHVGTGMGETLLRQFSSRAHAQRLMGTMKVPVDTNILDTYTRHTLALLVGHTVRFVSYIYNVGLHIPPPWPPGA